MNLEDKYKNWRNKYVRASRKGIYVWYNDSKENGDAVTVSEAHGYGMLISVLKRNQADFDGMLSFFDSFKNKNGLMKWQIDKNLNPMNGEEGMNSATDGDIDIATALFLAAKVWGKGGSHGASNYRSKAIELSRAIYRCNINPTTHMPNLGDWVQPESKFGYITRGSDFILSAFYVFMMEDKDMAMQWQQVLEAMIAAILTQFELHPQTGLISDFMEFKHGKWYPVKGKVLESEHDGDFHYNSCRVPWRLAHFHSLTKDPRVFKVISAQAQFFRRQIDENSEIRAGYKLNGKSYVDYGDRCFTAPVIYLFWELGDNEMMNRASEILNDDDELYFGATIDMLATLQAHVPY